MVRNPFEDESPDLQEILDALDDPDCRGILETVDEPMTASEISEECDIPSSTVYRKLELLTDASLLAESVEIRTDGKHTTRYEQAFERLSIELTDDNELEVELEKPAETADEKLANIWNEVRKEV
ncbi:MAG: helix-turn-helix domain-containing protein [Halobacteria archaeon]|nr:helix-turn-helix domain-containing protein [Halobacteria archaeon]